MNLESLIRDVPDFPQPGIIFKDITPLLSEPRALGMVTDQLADRYRDRALDKIIGVESRGFIFGAPLAQALGIGFVPLRKPGKLPCKTISESYTLEYGTNTLELHEDALKPGEKVLIVDDLIATGGSLKAACQLVDKLGGEVAEVAVIIELGFLKGREVIKDYPFFSLMQF